MDLVRPVGDAGGPGKAIPAAMRADRARRYSVYRRSLQGNASSEDAGGYGAAVTVLSELACGIAGISPR
ncbi:hypothetical protein WMF18_09010 [Sorangium sp. So ce315]|uniref:hypothetical protein n=1 Tax=Sorangium sp. So ce315 TaxID=3133299 RepID=UPI003F646F69